MDFETLERLWRVVAFAVVLAGGVLTLALLLALTGCGPGAGQESPCGDSFTVDIGGTVHDELLTGEDCYVNEGGVYDLGGCCPDGYEAEGFGVDGGVVCVGVCS